MNETKMGLSFVATFLAVVGGLAGCSSSAETRASTPGTDNDPGPDATSQAGGPSGPTDAGVSSTLRDSTSPAMPIEGGSVAPVTLDSGRTAVADGGDGGGTAVPSASVGGDSGIAVFAPPMPNCASGTDGVTNCGAGGSGNESCCSSLAVAGGTYDRTYTYGQTSSYADPATVSNFRLDKYLVTVGRFRQYVAYMTSGSGAPPADGSGIHAHLNAGKGLANSASPGTYEPGWNANGWNSLVDSITQLPDLATGPDAASVWNANLACEPNYATWTATPGNGERLPINCVDWYEASAFCIWDGGFLPSEAEWEYAAAGGSQQREYPWGSTDPGTANQFAIYGDGESQCYYPSGAASTCTGVANMAPVGTASKGAGYWGQLDLVGEVFEWNLDWYAPYAACTDCAYLTAASNRVMRGDLLNDATLLLPPERFDVAPSFRAVNLGFRCARTPSATKDGGTTSTATGTPVSSPTTAPDSGVSPGMNVPIVVPAGCTVPSPVSFTTDVQPFLNASCGKTGAANASNGGCHVLDNESTMEEGGKSHAYDWITGTAHASSCPETPTPFRFQVVMAVMQEADPPSCSKCDKMPSATTPPRTPLTACQLATFQSWLNESYVAQLHRYDGISPTTPYPMPPWN